MVSELYDVAERFKSLRSEINGSEPTVDRCRDWASMLADACEDLTHHVRELATIQRDRESYEDEQRERAG